MEVSMELFEECFLVLWCLDKKSLSWQNPYHLKAIKKVSNKHHICTCNHHFVWKKGKSVLLTVNESLRIQAIMMITMNIVTTSMFVYFPCTKIHKHQIIFVKQFILFKLTLTTFLVVLLLPINSLHLFGFFLFNISFVTFSEST